MKRIVSESIETHKKLLSEYESQCIETVVAAAESIIDCIKKGGSVYVCGNGGSAADAQHIAGELVGRFTRERKAFPVVALSTDTSVITSVGNDYGFEDIFARQVEGLVGEKDLLWAFSTSGTSKNIVAAARLAKDKGAFVLAFTGKSETTLEEISDLCLCIDAPSTASAQEIHQLAYHSICDMVEKSLCGND
jgi:D-sedoheptulose 7-phosphate isomerase